MLQALKRMFGRGADPAQLSFELEPGPRTADDLLLRLRALGLRRIARCRLTNNRNVMVSFRGGELRVHEGYLDAPPHVHQAIVTFIEGRTRAERHAAQRIIVSFTVASPASRPIRRERTMPEDEPLAVRLAEWHARYNADFFGGTLRAVPVRVSRRMKSRLGHYTAATGGASAEIAISWRHLKRHGWDEALHTLLHEMVHQWQDESGQQIDHGRAFRAKAREIGIVAAARRAPARRAG